MSNKQIFTKIYNAIPKDFFLNEDGVFECAIDIYLTYCGIRPGCIPFDGEVQYGGISSDEMLNYMDSAKGKKCINTLNNIKNLKVVIGPYYDTGTSILETLPFDKYPTVIIEATFLHEDHIVEAKEKKHLHIFDLLPYFAKYDKTTFVLIHFSSRYDISELKTYQKIYEETYKNIFFFL